MTTLCEKCFAYDGTIEVLTIPPGLNACDVCGVYDDRYKGGPVVHAYRSDPRSDPLFCAAHLEKSDYDNAYSLTLEFNRGGIKIRDFISIERHSDLHTIAEKLRGLADRIERMK